MQEWQQQRLAGRRPKPPPLCTVRRVQQGWGPSDLFESMLACISFFICPRTPTSWVQILWNDEFRLIFLK